MANVTDPNVRDAAHAPVVTRFAPSPNGALHLGHAYSAIVAHDLAHDLANDLGRDSGGRFLLRIEDIDGVRSKAEFAEAFRQDLAWLGLSWEEVPAQSSRLDQYSTALDRLREMGLLYPCDCTRAQIAAASPRMTEEGPIYPGTCRNRDGRVDGPAAWRLDVAAALQITGPLQWEDTLAGQQQADPMALGDVVLQRKEEPASYHLAVTLDDAADGVTLVTRGRDLFAATHIHRLLQALLGLPVPRWHHHPLVLDAGGKKLAKRRGSAALATLREAGVSGEKIATDIRLEHYAGEITLG